MTIQIPQPDFEIHVRIKNDKVMGVDWGEMLIIAGQSQVTTKQRIRKVLKYLRQAIRMTEK